MYKIQESINEISCREKTHSNDPAPTIGDAKADSYGNEKLKRKLPKSVFFGGGGQNIIRVNLMAAVLCWHGSDNKSSSKLVYAGEIQN